MHDINLLYTLFAAILILLGTYSGFQRLYLSVPLLALVLGVAIGPAGFQLVHPGSWQLRMDIVEELSRITLGIALVSVALRIPGDFLRQYAGSIVLILLLMMPFMAAAAGLMTFFFLDLPFWVAMLIGTALTPTDPVLASSIVTGKLADRSIPGRLRHFLSAESASNDGLAYVLVLFPLLVMGHSVKSILPWGVVGVILWEVGVAALIGGAIGFLTGSILRVTRKYEWIAEIHILGYSVAMALLALGAAKLIRSDGIFAVFIAGLAFKMRVKEHAQVEDIRVQEAVNNYFTIPVFVLLGMVIPWDLWMDLGSAGIVLCLLILAFRRLPGIFLFGRYFRPLTSFRDRLFIGWFGPIGISSLYYISFAYRKTNMEMIWSIGTLVICASILAHGVTATPMTLLYEKHSRAAETDLT